MSFVPPFIPSPKEVDEFIAAARFGRAWIIRESLDKYGENIINRKDSVNASALTWAAWEGRVNLVEILLERGADINIRGTDGQTALMFAAQRGKHDVVTLLLDKCADTGLKNDLGNTAAEVAKIHRHPDIEWMILNQSEGIKKQQKTKEQAAEKNIQEKTEARLEKLKKLRPSKSLLKKNQSPRP